MSSLRTATSAARSLTRAHLPLRAARTFSQSHAVRSGDHGSQYDPPSGWLFGVKPGEKYEKEGWEGPIYWGLCGSIGVAIVAYAFKPDTRYV